MASLIRVQIPMTTDQYALFQRLFAINIHVYSVYSRESYLYFSIKKKDLKAFRKVRKEMKIKVALVDETKKGIISPYSYSLIGVALFFVIPILFAQFIWTIHIESDSPENNILLYEELKAMNIKEKMLASSLPTEQEIRQKILLKYKEYSWVHFAQSGSTLIVSPMLAPIQTEREIKDAPPVHLIAKRSGVITDFELVKGVRAVPKNMAVKKGDTLVNGFVTQGDKRIITSAEGKVYASYWIELQFELPKKVAIVKPNERELLIQKKGKSNEPYWKEITLPSFLRNYVEAGYVQKNIEETFELNEKSMERLIRPLLFQKIINDLPAGTQILEDKVLQVSIQNDKVKGKVLLLVNENIAIPQVIPQGDEA
ncbi:sporulation protein YqfD [Psychrobacillus sp. NPDC096426]|uniref:sporulation protein YqfD n=1 Tax=Psychrobacillus sp. NPDC096426 TaxID=3364491 RepID=UPI0038300270